MSSLPHQVTELTSAFKTLKSITDKLPPARQTESGACGDWSPKEVIDHLIGWDSALADFATEPATFNPEPLYDVHAFNQASVSSRQNQSWAETIAEWDTTMTRLETALSTITPDQRPYPRIVDWLSGRIADYKLHTEQLEVF